jgi:tetratricopeptide (TPR) repeat protein
MKKLDKRLLAAVTTVGAIAIGGLAIYLWPDPAPLPIAGQPAEARADPKADPGGHATQAREAEVKARFEQAVVMLHAKRYDYAVKSLHRVLELAPKMPEAHVNMGYAMLGMEDYKAAADFFSTAIELNPQQLNAYYGLAVAFEGLGDLQLAISAMRSYIHLNKNAEDSYLAKARSALWEWESQVKNSGKGPLLPAAIPVNQDGKPQKNSGGKGAAD